MPMTCVTCRMEMDRRTQIEVELIAGKPLKDIERRYGISDTALHNHLTKCIPELVSRGRRADDSLRADTLITHLEFLKRETIALYDEVRQTDPALALKAIRALESQVQTAARIMAALAQKNPRPGGSIVEILNAARKRLQAHGDSEIDATATATDSPAQS